MSNNIFQNAPQVAAPADVGLSSSLANFYNFNSTNTLRLRAGIARGASGKGNGYIACIGDSNTLGRGAGSDAGGYQNAATKNYPFTLANLLAPAGQKHTSESWFGTQFVGEFFTGPLDPRLSFGTGWASGQDTNPSLGAYPIKWSGSTFGVLAFTPTITFDNFAVYYVTSTGLGTFTLNVDGGASLGTTNAAGTQALSNVAYSVTRGTHTINLTPATSGSPLYIVGMRAWDSLNPSVEVWSWGFDGSKAVDHTYTAVPWSNLNAYGNVPPDAVILNLMLNDMNANPATALATYISEMQTIITALTAHSDVILATPFAPEFSTASSTITPAILSTFLSAYYQLAQSNNLPLIDNTRRFGPYASLPVGYTFNELHLTQMGYGDFAEGVLRAINALA